MHKLEIPIPISTATAISFLLFAMRSVFGARKHKRSEFIRATGDTKDHRCYAAFGYATARAGRKGSLEKKVSERDFDSAGQDTSSLWRSVRTCFSLMEHSSGYSVAWFLARSAACQSVLHGSDFSRILTV